MFRLFKYTSFKEWGIFACLVIFILGGVICNILIPQHVGNITSMAEGVDISTSQPHSYSTNEILKEAGIIFGFLCGSLAASFITCWLAGIFISLWFYSVREMLYKKVNSFSDKDINIFSISSLSNRCTTDITTTANSWNIILRLALEAPLTVAFGIANGLTNFTNSGQSNFNLFLPVPIFVSLTCVTGLCILLAIIKPIKRNTVLNDEVGGITRDSIIGARTIRAFNANNYQYSKFEHKNIEYKKVITFIDRIADSSFSLLFLFMDLMGLSIYFIYTLIFKGSQSASPATIVATISLGNVIFMAFVRIIFLFVSLPSSINSARRINEVLKHKNSLKFTNTKKINSFNNLVFKNVSFKYGSEAKNVLEKLNFEIKKGETVAIIGSTGSGKSTLINLLPRFIDPTEGEILINGVDIKSLSRKNISKIFSYIPQKYFLFNDTIENNICYGKKYNFNLIKKAAINACAEEFIKSQKGGYKSVIEQKGNNLSGGQKQRISIARALYANSDCVIFDDSFSALDFITDRKVRENIKEKYKCTKIIIATRISTVSDADKIIVLKEGKIVGLGKHTELFKSCEEYKNIVLSQISKKEALDL